MKARIATCLTGRSGNNPHVALCRFSFHVLMWEVLTGEKPKRGSLRAVRVPEECPQVCGTGRGGPVGGRRPRHAGALTQRMR